MSNRRFGVVSVSVAMLVSSAGVGLGAVLAPSASANTAAYELFCPGSPLGTMVLNQTVTTGRLSPRSPVVGGSVSLRNGRTTFYLPTSIVAAMRALGVQSVTGTLGEALDIQGSSPATSNVSGTFNVAFPARLPTRGLRVRVPLGSMVIPVVSRPVTVAVDQSSTLTLMILGSPVAMSCANYPNNSLPAGLAGGSPGTGPISPVVAMTH